MAAECAFKRADHGIGRAVREIFVAAFAIWSELQHLCMLSIFMHIGACIFATVVFLILSRLAAGLVSLGATFRICLWTCVCASVLLTD